MVSRPRLAAVIGAALALPFLLLNAVVVSRLDPVFSWIRPGVHTGPFETAILVGAVLLVAVGAVVALAPVRRASRESGRSPVANLVIALVLLIGFAFLAIGLGEEVVRCEILGVPNCD
jgi:hypothetical protein